MQSRPAAINSIFFFLIITSIITAAYTGNMEALTQASFDSAKNAVTLALSLIGAMALWLGIMKIAEIAGLTAMIARAIRPIMLRLFPDVPPDHPAMSSMIMNMAANMLGLGNAATPFGIAAMTELDTLNSRKGTATNAMCLFLAINTSSVTLLPLGVIAVRAAAGAAHPAAILVPGLMATMCSTAMAIITAKLFAARSVDQPPPLTEVTTAKKKTSTADTPTRYHVGLPMKIVLLASAIAFIAAIPYHYISTGSTPHFSLALVMKASHWLIPALMGGLLLFGMFRGVAVYEALTDGAKEGFQVAIRIIPFMIAIFVAIGMFKASSALTLLGTFLAYPLHLIGIPTDVLPLALLRPLSGTGSFALMSEIVNSAPDSFSSFVASVMQGSTETTFYVLAVYFGAVGIRKTRYALTSALIADATGILAAIFFSRLMFRFFS